jgi:hypothetical protein
MEDSGEIQGIFREIPDKDLERYRYISGKYYEIGEIILSRSDFFLDCCFLDILFEI